MSFCPTRSALDVNVLTQRIVSREIPKSYANCPKVSPSCTVYVIDSFLLSHSCTVSIGTSAEINCASSLSNVSSIIEVVSTEKFCIPQEML